METIGLRYFNVFGKRQDPNGAYAAVIPLWVKKLMAHESPIINGDGSYSRDFTYIDNVIQANERAALVNKETLLNRSAEYYKSLKEKEGIDVDPPQVVMDVFNVAYGGNTTLFQLYDALRSNLAKYDPAIANIDVTIGPNRAGDIPHSLASIDKTKALLAYDPEYDATQGFEKVAEWYFNHLK
jgi:UDP-N-acetylglucosamine 4-epimerase